MRCTIGWMRLGILLLMMGAMSTSGCATLTPSAPAIELREGCRVLRRVLPDYSARDTQTTKEKGARFAVTFAVVCPP